MSNEFGSPLTEDDLIKQRTNHAGKKKSDINDVLIDLGTGHASIDCQVEDKMAVLTAAQTLGFTLGPTP